ncbi:hypothetical protein QOZ80_2AG0100020 [Eleusine coracana subsp. coracana]|nr:hypothetical protein QOZ80_2AG0100020 [Eleusine coracana subsp. coracana]
MAGDRLLSLSKDWDISHGQKFQAEVAAKVNLQVHYPKSSPDRSFLMLAVFRRYTFRLDEDTVSNALHSVLGGTLSSFHVRFASERHFRFSVASKAVGMLVYALRRVITNHFDVYFHLWRDGDSNWEKDKSSWEKSQDEEWTLVQSQKKKRAAAKHVVFACPLNQPSPTKKFKPTAPFRVIKFGGFFCELPPEGSYHQRVLRLPV